MTSSGSRASDLRRVLGGDLDPESGRLFRGADEHRALRVSRYVQQGRVRVSVWDESGTARPAVTLDEEEVARLAGFLAPPPSQRQSLLDELRSLVGR